MNKVLHAIDSNRVLRCFSKISTTEGTLPDFLTKLYKKETREALQKQRLSYKLRFSLNVKLAFDCFKKQFDWNYFFFSSMNSSFRLEKHLINALIQWQAESLEVISNHFFNFFEQLLDAINASNEVFKVFITSFWSYLQKKNH